MATLLILLVFCLIIFSVYKFSKRKFSYWRQQKVPYLEPLPFFGNFRDYILFKEYIGQTEQKICEQFPGENYVGAFYGTEPVLIVQDPEIIKLITTKDFYYFNSREVAKYTHKEVFTSNIFFTYGDRWKVLRQNLTPMFSSAKMRKMFHLIEKCAHVFEDLLDEETITSDVLEIKTLTARFTMDSIGSCAFGVDTNAMGKDIANNPFHRMGQVVFEISNARALATVGRAIWPAIFYGLRFKLFPVELNTFFNSLLTEVFKSRNYEASARNDFVDLLLNLKKESFITGDSVTNMKDKTCSKKINITVDDTLLVGQTLSIFNAGFETSSTAMTFTLYELAKNKDAQLKASADVDRYLQKHKNRLNYDCVTDLPYLEACLDEALRLYPVLGVLTREVVEEYTLPDGAKLLPGVRVHLPVHHLHYHPDNFPEPNQFRPERFLPENKRNIKPYTYLPFGEGPRICIG